MSISVLLSTDDLPEARFEGFLGWSCREVLIWIDGNGCDCVWSLSGLNNAASLHIRGLMAIFAVQSIVF